MAGSDSERLLRRIAEDLMTLRVTVVLSSELGGGDPNATEEEMRAKLHALWDDYLTHVDLERTPTAAASQEPRVAAGPADFGRLSRRAAEVQQRLRHQRLPGAARTARAPTDPTADGVVKRIVDYSERLSHDPKEKHDKVLHRLVVGKALALGTDPVLLVTEIGLDGDVTTRVNEAWLEADDAGTQRMHKVLELQRLGVEASVSWWGGLVEMVGKLGRGLIELVLGR